MRIFYSIFILLLCSFSCNRKISKQTLPADCFDATKVKKDAICPMIYKPVCGCDGKTYSNSCVASTQGILKWTEGACPEENK